MTHSLLLAIDRRAMELKALTQGVDTVFNLLSQEPELAQLFRNGGVLIVDRRRMFTGVRKVDENGIVLPVQLMVDDDKFVDPEDYYD